jgi:hypothetical protein
VLLNLFSLWRVHRIQQAGQVASLYQVVENARWTDAFNLVYDPPLPWLSIGRAVPALFDSGNGLIRPPALEESITRAEAIATSCGLEIVRTEPIRVLHRHPSRAHSGKEYTSAGEGEVPDGVQVRYRLTEATEARRREIGRPLRITTCAYLHDHAALPRQPALIGSDHRSGGDSELLRELDFIRQRLDVLAEAQTRYREENGRYALYEELRAHILEAEGYRAGVLLQPFSGSLQGEHLALWLYRPFGGRYCQGVLHHTSAGEGGAVEWTARCGVTRARRSIATPPLTWAEMHEREEEPGPKRQRPEGEWRPTYPAPGIGL